MKTYQHRVIPGSERKAFPADDRGPCKPHTIIEATIVLSPDTTLKQLSSLVRHAHRFGLSHVDGSLGPHSVSLRGTVEAMQKTFDVSLHNMATPDGPCRCRTGPLAAPKDFGSNVVAVLGLDTRPQTRAHHFLRQTRAVAEPRAEDGLAGYFSRRRSPTPTDSRPTPGPAIPWASSNLAEVTSPEAWRGTFAESASDMRPRFRPAGSSGSSNSPPPSRSCWTRRS